MIKDHKKRIPPMGSTRQLTRQEFLRLKPISDYVHIRGFIGCDLAGNPLILGKDLKELPVSPAVMDRLRMTLRKYWSDGTVPG